MATPFNPAFHEFMFLEGATHKRIEEHWEDAGDAENGPQLEGFMAHDLYTLDGIDYAVFENGKTDRAQSC
jgi:hypothetical protein